MPFVEHPSCSVPAFLAGLEHEDDVALESVAVRGKEPGCSDEHRGVQVVTTCVHRAVDLAGEVQPGPLLDGQRVHVPAQQDGRARARTAQDRGHRRDSRPRRHFQIKTVDRLQHRALGDRQLEADLGVLVQRATQVHQVVDHAVGVVVEPVVEGHMAS